MINTTSLFHSQQLIQNSFLLLIQFIFGRGRRRRGLPFPLGAGSLPLEPPFLFLETIIIDDGGGIMIQKLFKNWQLGPAVTTKNTQQNSCPNLPSNNQKRSIKMAIQICPERPWILTKMATLICLETGLGCFNNGHLNLPRDRRLHRTGHPNHLNTGTL